MADNTLFLDGDDPMNQLDFDDGEADMDIAIEADDEDDLFDEDELPDEPADDEFTLQGYTDFTANNEDADEDADDDDDDDDEDKDEDKDENENEGDVGAQSYDREYDDAAGQKRKRVKRSTPLRSTNTDAFIIDDEEALTTKPTSRVPGTFGRRNRKKGETLPAYHKKVSHELDSDDELMMEMREKGFSDKQIAEKLAKEGRVRYDQKSISTRIMRIRLAQAANVDTLLKNGCKEWEYEDDTLLIQAYHLADIEVSYEVERIRAWRFRKVSEYMRRLRDNAMFSAKACRERYDTLKDGNARIPTEMDDDPDARRFEMEAYRETRLHAELKAEDEKTTKETIERKAKDEARIRNAQKAADTALKRQQREEMKAQRAMNRAAAAQVRSQRAGENAAAKTQRNVQIQKQKAAADKKASKGKGKGKASPTKPASNNPNTTFTIPSAKITTDTTDPRTYLAQPDLMKMCAQKGIPALSKTKAQLISALQDIDEEWTSQELEKMCRKKGLPHSGNKLEMKYYLALAAAQECRSFRAGVSAATEAGEDVPMMEEEE